MGGASLARLLLVCTGLGSLRCASCWTRPLGGGLWGHDLCDLWGDCWAAQKTARYFDEGGSNSINGKPFMQALAGHPSLHFYNACIVCWVKGALRRNCRQKHGETSFSPFRVFLFSRNSRVRFRGLILWHLFIGEGLSTLGRTPHPSMSLLKSSTSRAGSLMGI